MTTRCGRAHHRLLRLGHESFGLRTETEAVERPPLAPRPGIAMGMRRGSLVVAERCGQLGNQFILFAHLIALAEEYGLNLLNPAFCEYANAFSGTQNAVVPAYPARRALKVSGLVTQGGISRNQPACARSSQRISAGSSKVHVDRNTWLDASTTTKICQRRRTARPSRPTALSTCSAGAIAAMTFFTSTRRLSANSPPYSGPGSG